MASQPSLRPNPIRTLIVDDHPVVRFGLSKMLGSDDSIEIVAAIESMRELLEVLEETEFDVMLLDLELGDANGVEAIKLVREKCPDARIIIYTSHEDDKRIVQAAELGTDGYLLKGCRKQDLIAGIHTVFRGGTALDPSVAAKIMQHMNGRTRKLRRAEALSFSRRERQVLDLLAGGQTNRAIGEQLFISESTVKFHMHAILDKLDARNRTQAVSIAAQHGLINLQD